MHKLCWISCAVGLVSGAAFATDKPAIGPAPAWVKPVGRPDGPTAGGDAAVRILLSDQQVLLEPGRQTVYSELALRIQTPQGLAAGNISFPWRPETDALTVHKLLIRRGAQVIDVLASGQTFTVVRRETNLESATLDGVLTANIQPEGLQVGDVIEFAASVTSSDPVLKGHVEQVAGTWNGVPIGRAHLRMQWPASLPVHLRQTAALPAVKPVMTGGTTAVELSLDDVAPVNAPKGAPPRYQIGRLIEASDFASWADLAALMAPLYRKAAVLPAQGPLRAEFDRIRAVADPKARAEAALALVQDRVRYVALAMGAGGLVPTDAETTWSRRYGDCKAKTALLLALLHALDIKAEPVAVSTAFGDGLDARLPMIALFNHVLVRAEIGDRTYWLDGTRTGDAGLDRLVVPAFGWGLPLLPSGATLVRMMPPPLALPGQEVTIRIDARGGLTAPAPARVETVIRGDDAIATNLAVLNLAGEARDRALRDYWRGQYDFIDVKSTAAAFDPKTGEERLVLDGTARMDWKSGWYETDGTAVGYKADFSRDPGPDRDAPFAVAYPYYAKVTETILLPPGFSERKAELKEDVNETVAGIEYRRRASFTGQTFTVEKSERSVAPEFPAKEADAAQKRLRTLAEQTLYLRRPADYRPTEAEVTAALAVAPTSAGEFLDRGNLFLNNERYDEAIADFDRALALEPSNTWALADRGLAKAWKGDLDRAGADLDAAAKIDGRNPVVFRARGLIAQRRDAPRDAVAAYTAALEIEPDSAFALGHRAEANRAAGDLDAALRDAAAALKIDPSWANLYLLRANIFRGRGKRDEALAEAAAVQAANPNDTYAHVAAANLYRAFGRDTDAMRAYDRALAIKPEAFIYINRSLNRPRGDLAGRRADLDAALKLEPKSADALAAKARLQLEAGEFSGAIATYSDALANAPDDVGLLAARGVVRARSGDTAGAATDFAAARAKATAAADLNNLCWAKATAGVALESALADCDAALSKAPENAAFHDSRALVLLRLGRLDEAVAAYDQALAKSPTQASSLFGRAVARARKGDKAKSDADLAAALNAYSDIRAEFEGYGVKL